MGRCKASVKLISDPIQRFITLTKRCEGLQKKAHDLGRLCGADVFMFVRSDDGKHVKVFTRNGHFSLDVKWMEQVMLESEKAHGGICVEHASPSDYTEMIVPDRSGNQVSEWKKKEKTSYVMDPVMRNYQTKLAKEVSEQDRNYIRDLVMMKNRLLKLTDSSDEETPTPIKVHKIPVETKPQRERVKKSYNLRKRQIP